MTATQDHGFTASWEDTKAQLRPEVAHLVEQITTLIDGDKSGNASAIQVLIRKLHSPETNLDRYELEAIQAYGGHGEETTYDFYIDESVMLPASEAENYSPNEYDFVWNADYTEFRPVKLQWTDNASYAAWQGDPWND